MAGLEIQIGADKSDFDEKIKEVEFDIKELSKKKQIQIKAGLDTTQITAQIKDAKKSLADLKTTLKDTGNAFASTTPKIANGGNALTQFSRIAQDAPFGIIGIGNNITATAESFGHLVKETGSAGGALKAVASSIMGTGGILLAVSLVTTGLTYMAQSGLTVKDVFDKMTGTFDANAQAMSKIGAEAEKSASTEISSIKGLLAVSRDETVSREKRLIAVQKLQEEYPSYFGNLTKEQILNGNVAGAVKEVTKALIAKAKAAALSSRIAELAEQEFLLRQKEKKGIDDLKAAYKDLDKKKNQTTLGVTGAAGNAAFNATVVLDDTKDSLKDIQDEIRQNLATQKLYTGELEKSAVAAANLLTVSGGGKGKVKKAAGVTPQVAGVKSSLNPEGLEDVSGKVVQIAKDVQGAEGIIKTSMTNIPIAFDMSGVAMLESLQRFNDDASAIINGSIAETFAGLGASIGEALATGGNVIQAVGKSLLSSLGGVLTELGKMAIQTGIGILAIKTALKTLNPYVAIAAGVALVALGSAVSSSVKGLGGGGGSSSGGGSMNTGASYSSPAQSTANAGGSTFGGGTVVFEINGTSLIGVLNNTLDKNRRLGGNLPIG